ncbi:unnamed protein product [Protopolystoma xenopodis]|uniref:Uncharacterized protein n=1 Tax=Protopolystoma xenopodis TaxID=117903 RepID=A0A3S4ZV57_9PLAT|nr:unnamed protein product [Protopolystoma xenopodis]
MGTAAPPTSDAIRPNYTPSPTTRDRPERQSDHGDDESPKSLSNAERTFSPSSRLLPEDFVSSQRQHIPVDKRARERVESISYWC